MKSSKKILSSSVAAAILAASIAAPTTAQAEVSASLAASNFYLWRGFDLSAGSPAISGDIVFSSGGAYGGVWASSGDDLLGQEYDLFVGYGGEAGGFSYDVSYWTYVYPSSDIDPGDAADLVIGLGYGDFAFTLYENLEEEDGAEDTRYFTFDYTVGDFNFLVGTADDGEDTFSHFQVSYAFNDNLTFTASTGDSDYYDDDPIFNISYSFDL